VGAPLAFGSANPDIAFVVSHSGLHLIPPGHRKSIRPIDGLAADHFGDKPMFFVNVT
jgi:hypothetical protein